MGRDERWPIGWTVTLMSIHLLVAIALLGIAASDLANYYGINYTSNFWSYWTVPQSCLTIVATIIHIILVSTARLNPGWTLSCYLLLWCSWVALATLVGITYGYNAYYESSCYSYYYEYYYTCSYGDKYLSSPKVIAELALISVCGLSGLAIWILCCVVVNRWRRERNILIQRGRDSQMPNIQYIQYTGPIPPGQYPGPPLDPKGVPYTAYYTVPPSDPNMVQYPHPTQPPPQHYSAPPSELSMNQYPQSTTSPQQVNTHYPTPVHSPAQLPDNTRSPPPSDVTYPPPVQSPTPIRKPVGNTDPDQYPPYLN